MHLFAMSGKELSPGSVITWTSEKTINVPSLQDRTPGDEGYIRGVYVTCDPLYYPPGVPCSSKE